MPESSPLRVDHVADYYHRYPGETVTFYTRVNVQQPLLGFSVRITVPEGLTLSGYRALSADEPVMPLVEFGLGDQQLTWVVVEELEAGSEWEYQVQAQVAPVFQDVTKQSRAVAYSELREGEQVSAEETVSIAVAAKGDYLRHLPALYQSDELMGRFLMLFESFWAPVKGQIDGLPLYFDPKMTPPAFLPWLASWFNLTLDEQLSQEQQRRLIQSAASLYRRRGTKQALQEYLEIYTGQPVEIIEHRAHDFRLGPEARLGPGVALGTGNRPHTFTVILSLPPIPASVGGKKEQARLERELRRTLETIIETEKPAHTTYTLRIEASAPTGRERYRR
jgi:phage tail-like protein